jgi:hypothetical protein
MTPRAEPQPGALDGCGASPPGASWPKCNGPGADNPYPSSWWNPKPRACRQCGGHIHSWARADAEYDGTACRMAAMRARRREARPVTTASDRRQS